MRRLKWLGRVFAGTLLVGFCLHEGVHRHRFGHFVPMALHIDVIETTSTDIQGVPGPAKTYEAQLRNYAPIPKSIIACEFIDYASRHELC